ncbi:hypothetical protein TNCV_1329121 [Trichonephila clavipes]|nr:hypothetical protein TNCV_1329121 [Trichonephila clavipes]
MTRRKPEKAPSSPNYHTTPMGRCKRVQAHLETRLRKSLGVSLGESVLKHLRVSESLWRVRVSPFDVSVKTPHAFPGLT